MINGKRKVILSMLLSSLIFISCTDKGNENIKTNEETRKKTDVVSIKNQVGFKFNQEKKDLNLLSVSDDMKKAYISYVKDKSRIYSTVDLSTNEEDVLYEMKTDENFFGIATEGVYDDIVYIAKVQKSDKNFTVEFITVDRDKKVTEETKSYEPIGDRRLYSKVPHIVRNGNMLWITEEYHSKENITSRLSSFDITNAKYTGFRTANCNIDDKGNHNGEYIVYCGSMDDMVYYQLIKYNNDEGLDRGESFVYRFKVGSPKTEVYSIETFEIEHPVKNRKLLFLSGDEKVIVTSDYVMNEEYYDSGLICAFNENNVSKKFIPDIKPANDILGAEKLGDNYLIYSPKKYY